MLILVSTVKDNRICSSEYKSVRKSVRKSVNKMVKILAKLKNRNLSKFKLANWVGSKKVQKAGILMKSNFLILSTSIFLINWGKHLPKYQSSNILI